MLHHLSFGVANLARSAIFYDAVLEPLGFAHIGYSPADNDDCTITTIFKSVRCVD